MSDWQELRRKLQREVAMRGAKRVADEIPAHMATVYRLVRGDTKAPSKAVEAAVERLVKKENDDDDSSRV